MSDPRGQAFLMPACDGACNEKETFEMFTRLPRILVHACSRSAQSTTKKGLKTCLCQNYPVKTVFVQALRMLLNVRVGTSEKTTCGG